MKIWLKTTLPSGNVLCSTLWTPRRRVLTTKPFIILGSGIISCDNLEDVQFLVILIWSCVSAALDWAQKLDCPRRIWLTWGLSSFYLKDIQAEIDAHNDIYKSVDGNKSKMVKALGSSEEAVFLQHRLDDMNQRWSDLKAKSASIRSVHLWANTWDWTLFAFCQCSNSSDCSGLHFLLLSTLGGQSVLAKGHDHGSDPSRSELLCESTSLQKRVHFTCQIAKQY